MLSSLKKWCRSLLRHCADLLVCSMSHAQPIVMLLSCCRASTHAHSSCRARPALLLPELLLAGHNLVNRLSCHDGTMLLGGSSVLTLHYCG